MKIYITVILSSLLLLGCHALNFQTEPKVEKDCQYEVLTGSEFRFKQLTDVTKGYIHVYVAQSKSSATLSAEYQGMKGKFTDNVIERNYPPVYVFSHWSSPFSYSSFDDEYDYFYLSPAQRAVRERNQKAVFQQAILQNCQIVYIFIDSLDQHVDNSVLIQNANLEIINKR